MTDLKKKNKLYEFSRFTEEEIAIIFNHSIYGKLDVIMIGKENIYRIFKNNDSLARKIVMQFFH